MFAQQPIDSRKRSSLDEILRELGGVAVIRLWRLHNGVGNVLQEMGCEG